MKSSSTQSTINPSLHQRAEHDGQGLACADDARGDAAVRADSGHESLPYKSLRERVASRAANIAETTFWFAETHRGSGIRKAIQAAVLLGGGIFLASQSTTDYALVVDTMIVAVACIAGGIYFTFTACRDLLGCVSVERWGIKIFSGVTSYKLAWHEIEAWEIVGKFSREQSTPQLLKLWKSGQSKPHQFELAWLSPDSRQSLKASLEEMVPLA
jgi:hypothetical protein